jgi:hypothetical protein
MAAWKTSIYGSEPLAFFDNQKSFAAKPGADL